MLLDTIRQFNWFDIFVVIILIRIGYIALASGLITELFKLMGTVSAIYLSLHYYTGISDFIRQQAFIKTLTAPLDFLDFICFMALAVLGYLLFVLLRSAFHRFIKMETAPRLNKWGGLVLGLARVYLLTGLITFMLVISTIGYLKDSAGNSYLGRRLFNIAPNIYNCLWNGIGSKFIAAEKSNETILEVQEDFNKILTDQKDASTQ